ncbi:MAG TPA: GNAT family N-acetyltransferase [Rhizomicrobium sp.]|jgi:ribosomal-protein-alanine N-acetyltransferase
MKLFDPMTDDMAALAGLHAACFAESWSAASLRDLFAGPGVFAFAQANGFILARAVGDEAEILTLAVAPPARRRGIASLLVRAAAAHAADLGAKTLFLEVATDNQAAIGVYEGVGFIPAGRRKAYYGGQDAHIFKCILPLPNPDEFA